MWIDFKLCSYFWFDNNSLYWEILLFVVNWFQIMFLFLVRQLWVQFQLDRHRCELISNYVLIFGSTTNSFKSRCNSSLWIDFKLCSYFWFDNQLHRRRKPLFVVNWFQIMFLFLVRQPTGELPQPTHSCELISNYVLIFGSTTKEIYEGDVCMLWIDFKLCSYFWFDNWLLLLQLCPLVVNWFQIMFLFLVRQHFI